MERYDLTPGDEESGYEDEIQPNRMPQMMAGLGVGRAVARSLPAKKKKPQADAAQAAHSIFTILLLAVGGFMLLAGVYLSLQEERGGGELLSGGFTMVVVALILRGLERCARALEKLAGRY